MDDKVDDVEEVFAAGAAGVNVLVDEEHLARCFACKITCTNWVNATTLTSCDQANVRATAKSCTWQFPEL